MNKIAKVTDAQLGSDPYGLEIKAMEVSRSLCEHTISVPFLRFVDIVCSNIYGELFMKCRNDLVSTMKQYFRATELGGQSSITSLPDIS